MKADLIYITSQITFRDVQQGYPKHEVLNGELQEWLFRPARILAESSAGNFSAMGTGMALLVLELMFFEHHGQYLTGKNSDAKASVDTKISSSRAFCIGFAAFRDYLVECRGQCADLLDVDPKHLYKLARCGLFHSFSLRWEFLVDARQQSASFERNPMPAVGGWLINPWQLLDDLQSYASEYVCALADEAHPWWAPDYTHAGGCLYEHFERTFDRIHPVLQYV